MTNFHDIEKARELFNNVHDRASEKYVPGTDSYIAEVTILELMAIAEAGLPDWYRNIREQLSDLKCYRYDAAFDVKLVETMILIDPRMPEVFETIRNDWGVSLQTWLERSN